jgi:hypothetical protein
MGFGCGVEIDGEEAETTSLAVAHEAAHVVQQRAGSDVRHGALADCYLVAAMGALAKSNPAALRNAVVDLGNGAYRVRFYSTNAAGRAFTKDVLTTYDAGARADAPLWPAIIEKAYAAWSRNPGATRLPRNSGEAMAAISGAESTRLGRTAAANDAFAKLVAAASAGKPMTAQAESSTDGAWHAYTILSVETSARGGVVTRTVTVGGIGLYGTFVHYDGRSTDPSFQGRTVTYSYDDFRRLHDDIYING